MLGSACEIRYIVYRLGSGASPVFLFGLGYATELKNDLGDTYNFTLGAPDALPAAVTSGLQGMHEGGKRRVLVPPSLGFVSDKVGPIPDTFGAQRRLISRRSQPLLFEVELVKVNNM